MGLSHFLLLLQGHFPRMENIAAFKPVSTSPPRSTCGVPEQSSYCQSPSSRDELHLCFQAMCVQECPYRSSTPPYAPLLSDGLSVGPGSILFQPSEDGCLVTPPSQAIGPRGSLTLAVWLKPNSTGEMMLLEKSSDNRLVFSLTVSERAVALRYGQTNGLTSHTISFRTEGRLQLNRWTHITLQIYGQRASLFLDGLEEDDTPFDTKHLINTLSDISEYGAMWVGVSSNGKNVFLCDVCCVNREIVQLYSGVLPKLHVQSECRCPPSHPRVHPLVERYCIPNAVEDTTNDRVLRLNLNAHPLSYVNDQDMGTMWLSKVMSLQELDEGVTITVDLANGQYQVFYVIVQFGGLLPESVLIQRRKLDLLQREPDNMTDQSWLDWQHMARNCNVFNMQNNGPLPRPDSVNCLQLPSDVPLIGGNITFSLLTTQPHVRPGYNDFYKTPALQEMVQAAQVRIHMKGQYYTAAVGVNQGHRQFAISEITISGRYKFGLFLYNVCLTVVQQTLSLCSQSLFCEHCAPLYNDKPFRSGDQLQPMNCRLCQCYGHAVSCHYDALADEHPDEHYQGGGGVCDHCMHNTSGKNCERCVGGFFRLQDSDPTSARVCQPCDCNAAGTVEGDTECAQIGGQCNCKAAVTGRQCAHCLPGWYGLNATNPTGCTSCNCSDQGTVITSTGAVSICNQHTGQCLCKPHVTGKYVKNPAKDSCIFILSEAHFFSYPGLSCESCEFGYWNLSHPDGCIPCDCDPLGSLSSFCEPSGGQCECKPGVGEGHHCDSCRHGYHTLEQRNSLGCLPCVCDSSGTVPEGVCDMRTGQCPCKEGVEGAHCTSCVQNYYNRSLSQGCVPCICDPRGTVTGSTCDSATGQCVCIPSRHGKDCSSCRPGFYLTPDHSVCLECDCHPTGAMQLSCESQNGQCVCAHRSVGGRRCDQCREMFFGFNPGLGRCQPCACDPEGSVNSSCDPDTGMCVCKLLVTGDKCDSCQPGASHFDPENPFGCSKSPSQQPSPIGSVLSYSSIRLSWHPPDSPNSHRLNYTLMRDGQSVHNLQRHFPFSLESFVDVGLFPFTNYSYWLITANVAGETISASASYQTLGAPPSGEELHLNLLGRPGPTSASFNWSIPRNDTGPYSVTLEVGMPRCHVQYFYLFKFGHNLAIVSPKIKIKFCSNLQACSSGGCTSSPPLYFLTAAAPPQNQSAPNITATGPHTLHASWEPPSQPNGIITKYELFLRGPLESKNVSAFTSETRVFSSSGWLDPSVLTEQNSTKKTTLSPPESSTIIEGMQAFSAYQLRVVSINSAGNVTSEWTTAHTLEGAPEFVAPPDVSALSSSTLNVTWNTTEGYGIIARGQVTEYRVNLVTEQTTNPYAPPVISQVTSSWPVHIVEGLKPYHVYNFTVALCTRMGCVTSLPSTGQTLPAVPTGLSSPRLHPVNETTIQIDWDPPVQLNGPSPLYQVERTDVSLSDPQEPVIRGTRFPGNGYYQFPSNTLPNNADFTGVKFSFKTWSPDGLLLSAFSPGHQEEFLAIQIKNGRPYFLFDPQGSAVAVGVHGDGNRRYNDGQWHNIVATRQRAVGTITINLQYTSSENSIIGENMGLFIGGLPEDFAILRNDSGDTRLVRRGFSGCLRDISLKMSDSPAEEWEILDWKKATKKVGVYESWEGCPLQTVKGVHFLGDGYLELDTGVFSGGHNFDILMDFRTDQLSALLLFAYSTQTEDYMLVELEAGLLSFILASGGRATELRMWVGLSYCDGDWKKLSLAKQGSLISAAVGDWAEEIWEVGEPARLRVNSALYLGGVPIELSHPGLNGQSHKHGKMHKKCQVINLSVAYRRSVRVNLDGCPTTESRFNCRGNDSVLVYTGRRTQATDYSLLPFTEYLYRFVAVAPGGLAASPWQRGRSHGKVPTSVAPPATVESISGFSAKVRWLPPTGDVQGLIDRYELKAYNKDHPEVPPITATYLANGNFTGVITGLTPSTQYIVTVSACSPAGCTESPVGNVGDVRSSFKTPEEGKKCTSLGVYSTNFLILSACTKVGCTNSSQVTALTSELPPGPLHAPSLTLLDSRSILVEWSRPSQINGVLKFYSVLLSSDGSESILAYNSSEPAEEHTLRSLTPGTFYSVMVAACTGGGCTRSPPSHIQTEESTPENVPAPLVIPLSPHSLNISWTPPETPNGVITSYGLWMDGVLVFNSSFSQRFFIVEGLSPWSRHVVRLQACTAQGCGKGPLVESHTLEMAPEGPMLLELTNQSSRSLRARWTAPPRANGNLLSLFILGLCFCVCHPLDGHGVLDGGSAAGIWLSVSDLQPYTNYSFWIRGCNTQGCVESLPLIVTTPPAAPDGLSPLTLVSATNTSLNVSWSAPVNSNAPGPLLYSLHMKTSPQKIHGYEIRLPEPRIFHNTSNSLEFNVTVTDLVPYTNYSITVLTCSNGGGYVGGCTESLPTPASTLPTTPDDLAPLSVVPVSESFLAISWQLPSRPNGPNIRYKLLRRKTHQPLAVAMVPTLAATSPPPSEDLHRWFRVYSGTKLFYEDKGLSRFTRYQYQLVVYNDVGYSSGNIVTAVTMAGVPLKPPTLSAHAINHTAVQVNWNKPSLQDLQGEVESFFLTVTSSETGPVMAYGPDVTSTVIGDLWPSTTYLISLQVFNGAHNTTKSVVYVTTADGEPEGMSAPEVVPVNSSTARVLWFPPHRPNGAVTGYGIYVDDRLHGSVDNSSGSYLLGDLLPFTVYNIQVEVCTVYACTLSNITRTTTAEDLPADLPSPHAQVISPRLDWAHPGRPSGIMLGYEVLRRTLRSCTDRSTGVTPSSDSAGGLRFKCSYLQCPVGHSVCGTSCFHPETQICCNGLLHTRKSHHHCCDELYFGWDDSSHPVCCNGKLVPSQSSHQCCGRYYVPVKTNEYCCPDHLQGRVSVGPGDSCCGGVPYSMIGGQLCCSGRLHDGYGVQCCGGKIVDDVLVCCDDAVHTYKPGFICCGKEYINSSTSLCCMDNNGYPTIHPSGNATVKLQCCGSKVIHLDEKCCNGIGFDPQRHVCADQATGVVCPVAAAATSYCGSCDLDPSLTACTWVLTAHPHPDTQPVAQTSFISTRLETLSTVLPAHTNTDLEPFTTYEYRVRGWNSFGPGSTDVTTVTTSEAKPWGLAPPRWSRRGERNDIVQLQWQAPARPNGIITHYVVLRDGQERYRGDENTFTDVGGIGPFQEFVYQLRACNQAGCTDSTKVVAVTAQGVPEDVKPPVVKAISSSSLHVSWSAPSRPKGVIQRYHLNQTGVGTVFTHTGGLRNYTVIGLQPYTDYSFVLVACTTVGCAASGPSTGRTLQASPSGVWSSPRHLIINTSAVELYWDPPSQPNGHVFRYRLIRDGRTVFTGDHQDQKYIDTGLLPKHRYLYELEASTAGGTGLSDKYAKQTPASCPTGIPPPYNMTVSGPHSISLTWSPPAQLNSSQPVFYNVLLNPGSHGAISRHAGQNLHLTVTDLEPFTTYYIRVQACQNEGCGVGDGVYIHTLEEIPEGLQPPTVKALGPSILEIHWTPPEKPNGLITSYHIYRRPLGTEEELLVFIWSSGLLEFVDASPALQPFSFFQYKVRAHNSKGSVVSQWARAQTLQAKPGELAPPVVRPTGAYSVYLKWREPDQPNGLISHYRLVYMKHQQDPTLNSTTVTALTVKGSVLEAAVFGLDPFSPYRLRVEAVNGAGSVSSLWVEVKTLEASPTGLGNFTVEQREEGRALLLSWDEPQAPNGVITMYNLYSEENLEFSGLSRSFLFRRLEPWTVYSLTLEACTAAGCTLSPPQHITTAAAPPASQLPPRPLSVGADRVSLTWDPPSQPNGPIGEYSLLGRSLEERGKLRNNEEDTDGGKVLFTGLSPQEAEDLSYTVTGLRPWTQYEFSVCTHNPAGHTCSPWVTVTTRQASPRGLASPTVRHVHGRPSEVVVSWTPPLEPNGVLQSYRMQRNNVNFKFSFDPTILTYIDEDLHPFSTYSYSVTACTSEGCTTSPQTKITTLEAPPEMVEPPTVNAITSHHINVSWSKPLMQNGQVTEYVLKLNNKEAYRGRDLNAALSYLQPHTSYQLVLLACTRGGCTASSTKTVVTEEAPPTHLAAPTLKVTGPESIEITWRPPNHPNGIITGYELHRDGEVIYIGRDMHYHDFTLIPSMEYSYVVRANNSKGAVSSEVATAKTHQSAPSGVGFPTLTSLEVGVEWQTPARPNGDIVSYSVYLRDPVHLNITSSSIYFNLCRYEVRVEACTELGCSSSDWSSILTLEAPPAGQPAPLLDLTSDPHTGLQTSFLLTWSPPGQSNGRILHYEVHRRQNFSETDKTSSATVVYRNVSASFKDGGLQPYTAYQYQVWAVNSAGYASSRWVSGRTGPAPPQGIGLPIFLDVSATSAAVNIHPPAQPNGIVSLFRVFSLDRNNITTLVATGLNLSLIRILCFSLNNSQCCSRGPVRELHTLAAPPDDQHPPRLLTLTSRSVQMEWDEPTAPNGVIDSCELHIRTSCPQPPQPVPLACTEGPTEICFFGKQRSYNVTGLQPYSAYELRAACFNKMGSTASNWTAVSTLSEPPQYVSPFSVDSNLTVIWLDWTDTFSLNGFLKEFTVTESQLRVYSGFYSHLHIPRTSRKSEGASTKHIHMLCSPLEPVDGDKQGISISATPIYSELWFILLFVLLGLFLLAILIGLLLKRYIHVKKNPSARERPPLVMLQKTRKAGGDTYKGLADTKIIGSSSRYSPMSVLRAPSQTDLTQAYSQHSLHRSVSQLIDRKSLMEEGCWDNPLGHDSGLYVEEDEFVDAIKALSSVKKEHSLFIDTHL
uniref:Usher syndrome 2A (autosomal recessive, mild) n=1 Tax=Xiphophorus couchianus TaxID=32473 RepID=A0A3B5M4G7_9TELE